MLTVLGSFTGKPAGLLGVDIGAASIKLVELSKQAHGWRVEAYGMEPLPPDVVVDGQFSDVEGIGEAVQALKRRCGCRLKRAAVALSGPSAVVKTLEVDAELSDEDVAAGIEVEAERHLPGPPDETAYDFEVQGLSSLHPKRAEAVLAACPKGQVSQAAAALRAGRLQAAVVELEALALARGLAEARAALPGSVEAPTALFDVDEARLRVFERGLCLHSATEAAGGLGLVGDQDGQPTIEPGRLAEAVGEALTRIEPAAAQTRVGAVLLAGQGLSAALADAVGERLGLSCAIANPFAGMALAPRIDRQALAQDASGLLTACGLALRSGP